MTIDERPVEPVEVDPEVEIEAEAAAARANSRRQAGPHAASSSRCSRGSSSATPPTSCRRSTSNGVEANAASEAVIFAVIAPVAERAHRLRRARSRSATRRSSASARSPPPTSSPRWARSSGSPRWSPRSWVLLRPRCSAPSRCGSPACTSA